MLDLFLSTCSIDFPETNGSCRRIILIGNGAQHESFGKNFVKLGSHFRVARRVANSPTRTARVCIITGGINTAKGGQSGIMSNTERAIQGIG